MSAERESRPSDLQDHLGYWLRMLSNRVSLSFERRLAALGVSVPQWVALRVLYRTGKTPVGRLAELVQTDQGAVSRLVDRLVSKGLVAKGGSDEDRRSTGVELTEAGRALVPALAREADQNDADFFGHLTKRKRSTLLATVQEIIRERGIDDVPTS